MSQPFQFKQFKIEQHPEVFKVGTDGCLLGALLPTAVGSALEVGTGTGVVACMLAQRAPDLHIDALDSFEPAYRVASRNFAASKWSNRLQAHHVRLQDWHATGPSAYDLIFSNPPFFKNALLSQSASINLQHARHEVDLTLDNIAAFSQQHLQQQGTLVMIIPTDRLADTVRWSATYGLHFQRAVHILPTPLKPANRVVCSFGFEASTTEHTSLLIRTNDGAYTEAFCSLLRPYYLHF